MAILYYETSNSLKHHGVKGQKWGVRRFQNKDGTLTAKGKKRYKDDSEDVKSMSDDELRTKINRMRNEKRYIDLTKKDSRISKASDKLQKKATTISKANEAGKNSAKLKGMDTTAYDIAGNSVKAVSKSVSAAKKVDKMITEPKHIKKTVDELNKMSDDDLKKIVDRLDLERQYSDVSKESRARGKVTAEQILDVAGDVLSVAASVTGIAVGIKLLKTK